MTVLVVLAGCSASEPIVAPSLTADPPADWSLADPTDQHHATTAFAPDGTLAVAWTVGPLPGPTGIVLRTDDLAVVELGRGRFGAKPDIEADALGRWLVAYQLTAGGIGLDRVDGATVTGVDLATSATGNNSVDVAVQPDGSALTVWYEEGPVTGAYHAVLTDPGLRQSQVSGPLAVVASYTPVPPDAAPMPDGGALYGWMDQAVSEDLPPDILRLTRLGADGTERWTVDIDQDAERAPRRPTIGVDPTGRSAVVYRRYLPDQGTTAEGWLAAFDDDGSALTAPVSFTEEVAERPVLAQLGAEAVAVAWSTWDGSRWWVELAVYGFPGFELIAGPITLSDGAVDADRPHVAAHPAVDGVWELAVSWEEGTPGRVLVATAIFVEGSG